jgi:hypothetical protein
VFIRRGSQLEVWINGVLDNNLSASVISFTHTQPLQIANGVAKFDGGLDEVAFYPSALSAIDILQHYRQSLEPSQAAVRHTPDWLYAKSDERDSLQTPLLLSDARGVDETRWIYDPSARPALQQVSAIGVLDLSHFNALLQLDVQGADLFERRTDSRGEYLHRRLPSGAALGLVPTSGDLTETWSYGYDAVSNINSITKPAGVESYGYNSLDRLNAYTLPSQAQVTYGYGAVGNRLSETQSGVGIDHTYGSTSNRHLTAAGASIGYDANGNRSSDGSGTRTFLYDVRNRLRQVVANSQTVATYTHNANRDRFSGVGRCCFRVL